MVDRRLGRLNRQVAALVSLAVVLALGGCGAALTPRADRADVSRSLEDRTQQGLADDPVGPEVRIPPGIHLDRGVSASEAATIALWNNAEFQIALSALGFAKAELHQSGLLRNPVFSLLFPWGPKQLEATLSWPLEALWLRPHRIEIAQLNLERLVGQLVQDGLDLARRAKHAQTDLLLAQERLGFFRERLGLEEEIAGLTKARLEAGDISEREAAQARSRVLLAEEELEGVGYEAVIAMNRLKEILGLALESGELRAREAPLPDPQDLPPFDELLREAFSSRPDLRGSELAMELAGKRLGLERARVWQLTAILDMNGEGRQGFEAGPGLSAELPLFNRNQAGKELAAAEMEQAMRTHISVQRQIAAEIRQAEAQFRESAASLGAWTQEVLPNLEGLVELASAAHAAGEISLLEVLEARRKLVESQTGASEAAARLRRAAIDLDYGVGRNRFSQ